MSTRDLVTVSDVIQQQLTDCNNGWEHSCTGRVKHWETEPQTCHFVHIPEWSGTAACVRWLVSLNQSTKPLLLPKRVRQS